jgi:hypothetical protein
MIDLSLS